VNDDLSSGGAALASCRSTRPSTRPPMSTEEHQQAEGYYRHSAICRAVIGRRLTGAC
jgi:hypothetical protein